MTPFQTFGAAAPPSNMMFPTAAYLQAAGNAADMRLKGSAALGAGIAEGIGAAASGYMKYKDTKAEVGAAEKSYQTLKSFLPPEVVNQIDNQIESINQDPDVSLRDKAAFWKQTKSFLGDAVGQAFQMQKQQNELNARMAQQQAAAQTQFDLEQARQKYRAQQGSGVNFGLDPISGGPGNNSSYYNSQYGE
jgi:hypothetical protein